MDESEGLKEELKKLGAKILSYLSDLKRVIHRLSDFHVKNVIFHTDDYDIPWALSCFGSGTNFEFVSAEYPCGTVLVDDAEDALRRLKDQALERPQYSSFDATRRVCVVCGDLGGRKAHAGLAFKYAQQLQKFFQRDRSETFKVQCYGPSAWREYSGNPKKLIGWLNVVFENADIVHYIGHVSEGRLCFDEENKIGSTKLKRSLDALESRPLVVLQACESAGLAGREEGAHLCRIFLEKGASGCLAPVLPISIPSQHEMFSDTLIALFYKNILSKVPYGRALANAQREYASKWSGDPQGYFFQLFGDPRAIWTPPSGPPSHLALMARAIEEEEAKGVAEILVRVSVDSTDLSEAELEAAIYESLREVPDVRRYSVLPRSLELGGSELLAEMGPTLVLAISGLVSLAHESAIKGFLTEFGERLAQMIPLGKTSKEEPDASSGAIKPPKKGRRGATTSNDAGTGKTITIVADGVKIVVDVGASASP